MGWTSPTRARSTLSTCVRNARVWGSTAEEPHKQRQPKTTVSTRQNEQNVITGIMWYLHPNLFF